MMSGIMGRGLFHDRAAAGITAGVCFRDASIYRLAGPVAARTSSPTRPRVWVGLSRVQHLVSLEPGCHRHLAAPNAFAGIRISVSASDDAAASLPLRARAAAADLARLGQCRHGSGSTYI